MMCCEPVNVCRNCVMLPTAINWTATVRPLRARNVTTARETDTKISCHVSGMVFSCCLDHIDFFAAFFVLIVNPIFSASLFHRLCVCWSTQKLKSYWSEIDNDMLLNLVGLWVMWMLKVVKFW